MQPNPTKLFLALLLLLLAGCVPSTAVKEETQKPPDPRLEQVAALESVGDYPGAAALLELLAGEALPPEQQSLLLRAAENRFKSDDNEAATALLNRIDTTTLPQLDFHKRLLVAEMALARNRPDEALALLDRAPPQEIGDELQKRFHRGRAEGFRLSGNLLESARELGELDLIMLEPMERLDNQLAIIQTLSTLTDTALELLQPIPPGIQGGWMELARIIKGHSGDSLQIRSLLDGWRERFPSHPAMPELLDGYFEKLKAQYRRPDHLALLLPSSGAYAKAATAIREGFLAAYYQHPQETRPRLVFYDSSNSGDTWPLYQEAVAAGAEMVIGPLSKEGVSQLARAGVLEVPVLALNQVEPEVSPPEDLYQFGLSPEDEARQVAERAWLDGHARALVLTPRNNWGQRIFEAFRDRWERLGGTLSEYQTYNPRMNDFSHPIRAMLDLDQSNRRRQALQTLLGKKLAFEPRRREDVDFIFLAANAQTARQIRPQLQFHQASGLPVYSTSHIYAGMAAPEKDSDLEGIRFPDIPWLLAAGGDDPLSRDNLSVVLPNAQGPYQRLYAMGIDSFRLLPHLARLQLSPREALDGKTGNLFLDPINQLHRQLVWAEMLDGSPRVIGYAPRLELELTDPRLEEPANPFPVTREAAAESDQSAQGDEAESETGASPPREQ